MSGVVIFWKIRGSFVSNDSESCCNVVNENVLTFYISKGQIVMKMTTRLNVQPICDKQTTSIEIAAWYAPLVLAPSRVVARRPVI